MRTLERDRAASLRWLRFGLGGKSRVVQLFLENVGVATQQKQVEPPLPSGIALILRITDMTPELTPAASISELSDEITKAWNSRHSRSRVASDGPSRCKRSRSAATRRSASTRSRSTSSRSTLSASKSHGATSSPIIARSISSTSWSASAGAGCG
jgi:hypothetical protein